MKPSENFPHPYKVLSAPGHLSDYLAILQRRKWVVLLVWLLVMGGAVLNFHHQEQVYRASALIMIERKPSPMDPLGETETRSSAFVNPYYKTEVKLLSHRTLIQTVIRELELEKYYVALTEEPSDPQPSTSNDGAVQLQAEIVEWYTDHFEIEPVPESNLVHIRFSGPDPEMAAKIVNTHAEKASEDTVQLHQKRAKSALDWLKAQLERQKKEVKTAQESVNAFKKDNDLMMMGGRENIFSQEFAELNNALIKARADHIASQAAYLQLDRTTDENIDTLLFPEISDDTVIQNLKSKLSDIYSRRIEMASKYGPKHTKMIELNATLAHVKSEINAEIARLRRTIKAQADRAASIEALVTRQLEKKKKLALSMGEKLSQYDVLQQQAESSREIYDFLLKQAEEISLASVMSSSHIRVIDPAEIPTRPDQFPMMLVLLAAAFVGLFMGTGLALFLEYMDNTVKTPIDVSVRLGMTVFGVIPYDKAIRKEIDQISYHQYSLKDQKKLIADPVSRITSRLSVKMTPSGENCQGRVIAVESVTMGEGKTVVVSKIAANLTSAGLRVLLLDSDFQRSTLTAMVGLRNGGGLERAIHRIEMLNIGRGELKDFSVDDIFFLIQLKRLSGELLVRNDDSNLSAFFLNGALLHIQDDNNPTANRLGRMLLQGKFISEDQLQEALARHNRTGRPLGYILVNSGYVSREKLRGSLRLQMEDHIQKLFSWKSGHFHFSPGLMRTYESERILYAEDFSELIDNLGWIEGSKMVENIIFEDIVGTKQQNLFVLPANSSTKRPIGHVNRALLRKLLEIVKTRFDVVLIDTPPLDAQLGVETLSSFVDGIIVVISAGNLSYRIINSELDSLPRDKIIGAVLNKVRTKPSHYNYYTEGIQ
ncbi:MAG: hypothetical protein VR64_06965 [Desulfatitalea sp. BRH_c12]|nr:MAG: hypothetical protein VR64_06965 [Desulfatitalea sp. BRH_c12]